MIKVKRLCLQNSQHIYYTYLYKLTAIDQDFKIFYDENAIFTQKVIVDYNINNSFYWGNYASILRGANSLLSGVGRSILERSCHIIFTVTNFEGNFKDHKLRVHDYFHVKQGGVCFFSLRRLHELWCNIARIVYRKVYSPVLPCPFDNSYVSIYKIE